MKFRFCGESDCPDWILAEISGTLSTLTSIKFRIICQQVARTIHENENLQNEHKVLEIFNNNVKSAKSAIACIRFMLLNASRYNTEEETFNTELQQLGLPKELAQNLCKVYSEHLNNIKDYLLKQKIRINGLDNVQGQISENAIDCAKLEIKIKNEICAGQIKDTTHVVNIHKSDLSLLLQNLKQAKAIMDEYDFDVRNRQN